MHVGGLQRGRAGPGRRWLIDDRLVGWSDASESADTESSRAGPHYECVVFEHLDRPVYPLLHFRRHRAGVVEELPASLADGRRSLSRREARTTSTVEQIRSRCEKSALDVRMTHVGRRPEKPAPIRRPADAGGAWARMHDSAMQGHRHACPRSDMRRANLQVNGAAVDGTALRARLGSARPQRAPRTTKRDRFSNREAYSAS